MAGKIIHNLSRNFSARYNLTNAESLMFGHWLDNKPNIRFKQSQYFDLKTVAVLNCLCIKHCSPRYFLNTTHNCVILQNFQKKRILIHLRDYKTVAKIICVLSLKSCDKTYGSLKKALFTFHMLKNILIAMLIIVPSYHNLTYL